MTTLGSSEKSSQLFIEFKYGDPAAPTILRLTRYTYDTLLDTFTWTAAPDLEVSVPDISGVLNDKPLSISGPPETGSNFFARLGNGEPHSPVYVTVWEVLKGTAAQPDQRLKLFTGRVARVTRNYRRQGWILIEMRGIKLRLNNSLGIIAMHQCSHTLGDRGCKAAVVTSTGTMTVITGKTVTITGLSGQANRFWHRGFVERQGLRLPIREWVSGTTFELTDEPPADWVNQSVKVYEGCDKTIETCRAKFANEANFVGIGHAMLPYSPNWELS